MPAFNRWRNGHHPLWGNVAESLTQQKVRVRKLTFDYTPPSIVPWRRVELVSQNCIPESLCWAPGIQSGRDRRVPPGTGTQTGQLFGVGSKEGLVKMGGVEPGSTGDGASQVELVVRNPPASAGDVRDAGSIPGSGRSPGEGNSGPLQYSCLENPSDGGARRAAVPGVAKSRTRLSNSAHAPVRAHGWEGVDCVTGTGL